MLKRLWSIPLASTLFFSLNTVVASASEGAKLTDLFETEAFRGSFEWFSKLQWLGVFLQMIISISCFIGIFSVALQTVTTLVYYSNRTFWDNVYEEKNDGGFGGVLEKHGKGGFGQIKGGDLRGIDALIKILYAFLPNAKKWSDLSPENKESNLTEEDTITTWFIKTAGRKIIIILFLSMGMNGSLMQVYGMVVDGLGVVTERVVTYNLEDTMEELLNTGSKHTFTLGATGTPVDELRQSIAKNIYTKLLSQVSNKTTENNLALGKSVEEWVAQNVTMDTLLKKLNSRWTGDALTKENMTDRDWKNVKADVTLSQASVASDFSVSASTLLGGGDSKFKVHIITRLTRKQNDKNIFEVKTKP